MKTTHFLRYLTVVLAMTIGVARLKATIMQLAHQQTGLQLDSDVTTGIGIITRDVLAQILKGFDSSATAITDAAVDRFGNVGLLAKDFSNVYSDSALDQLSWVPNRRGSYG